MQHPIMALPKQVERLAYILNLPVSFVFIRVYFVKVNRCSGTYTMRSHSIQTLLGLIVVSALVHRQYVRAATNQTVNWPYQQFKTTDSQPPV